MNSPAVLQPSATHLPSRWVLPVASQLCTPAGHLSGGAALGACLLALEQFTGRATVWAAGQYLAFADADQVLDVDVRVAAAGRRITQARAVGHVGEREILTVNAALAAEGVGGHGEGQWVGMPALTPPAQGSPLGSSWPGLTVLDGYETRVALGREVVELRGEAGDGRSALWCGLPPGEDVSVASLAVMGDALAFGISQLLGTPVQVRSLDNTLRICHIVPTQWVLLDIYAFAVAGGMGHGAMHLWAEDGTLLGTTSQSCAVRPWQERP